MKYTIRYPNSAGMMRGNNMMKKWCVECQSECSHGYFIMYEFSESRSKALFICDDCLKQAKKEAKGIL